MFITFLVDRYISGTYLDWSPQEVSREKARMGVFIAAQREELTIPLHSHKSGKSAGDSRNFISMTHAQKNDFVKIIRPSTKVSINENNPWRNPIVQLRNYTMITIMLNYGLRIGELLSLETNSFKRNESGNGYTLLITTAEETGSNKSYSASIKNNMSHRALALHPNDFKLLHTYRQVRGKLSHPRLFVSTTNGEELHYGTVNDLIKDAYQVFADVYPDHVNIEENADALTSLSAHVFRHTWACFTIARLCLGLHEQTAASLADALRRNGINPDNLGNINVDRKSIIEDAKSQLRTLAGWSYDSNMPSHYAKRYLSAQANAQNLLRMYDLNTQEQARMLQEGF